MNTPAPQKYLFDTDFAEEIIVSKKTPVAESPLEESVANEEAVEEELPPPPPTFSEEEVAAAREEGFQAGRSAALQDVTTALEQHTTDSLAALQIQLKSIAEVQEKHFEETLQMAVGIAAVIVHKLYPRLEDMHAVKEIEMMVRDAIQNVYDRPLITIRINPALQQEIERRMKPILQDLGFKGEISVISSDDVSSGDCHVVWENGGVIRNTAEIWQKIDEIIERNLGPDATTLERPPLQTGNDPIADTTKPAAETPSKRPESPKTPPVASSAQSTEKMTESVENPANLEDDDTTGKTGKTSPTQDD